MCTMWQLDPIAPSLDLRMSAPLLWENKYQTDRQTDNNSLADTVDLDSLPIPRFVDPASRQQVQRP